MLVVGEIGKKQYIFKEGNTLKVERLKGAQGQLLLDRVLLLADKGKVSIGKPYLEGVKVKAEVIGEEKGEKVTVYKYKRRKKYRKKQGHRQLFTLLKISQIITPSR